MDLPGLGPNHEDVEKMKPPPMIDRVIGSIPILVIAALVYAMLKCSGWNPN